MAIGRPSIYTDELAEKICEQIATTSKSMKTICNELSINVMTVLNWLCETHDNYRPEFSKMYARAKEMQSDFLVEEIIEISDDSRNDLLFTDEWGNKVENKEFVNRSRLRVDSRKWIASKLRPKKYGDKLDITSDGEHVSDGKLIEQKYEQLLAAAREGIKANKSK